MRKFLSLALALVMVLGLVPAMLPAAQAAETASLYTDATAAPAALAAANIDGVISEGEYSASFDAYRTSGSNPPIVKYYLAPTSIDLHFAVEMQIDVSGMTADQKASLGDNITVETEIYRGDYRTKTDTDPGFVAYTSGMSGGAYKLYYRQAIDNALKSHTATSTRLRRTVTANDETNIYTVVLEHRYQMNNDDLIFATSTTDNAAGVYTISSKVTLTDGTNTLGLSYFAPGLTGDVSASGYYENGYYVTNSSYVEPDVPVEPEEPTIVLGEDVTITPVAYKKVALTILDDGSYTLAADTGITYTKTYTKDSGAITVNAVTSGKHLTITRDDGAELTISFSRETAPAALTATNATTSASADGTIIGVAGAGYEINTVSSETEDANWQIATVENGVITGLTAGSYYVRTAGYMDESTNTYYLPSRAYAEAVVVGYNSEAAATPVLGTDVTFEYLGYNWMLLSFNTPGTYTYANSANSDAGTVEVTETSGPVTAEMRTNASNEVTIVRVGDGANVADSLPLTIARPGRKDQPTGLTAVNATTSAAADGKITGIDAAKNYEINSVTNDNSSKDWTAATVVDGAIANLVPGTYYVREAASDNGDGTYTLASKPFDGALVVGADVVVEEPTIVLGEDVSITPRDYKSVNVNILDDGSYTLVSNNGITYNKTYTKDSGAVGVLSLSSGKTLTITRVEDGAELTITFSREVAPAGPFTTTNATAPDAADGTIIGVAGVGYEINAVSNTTTDANWQLATVENGVITGLAAGSYYVRTAGHFGEDNTYYLPSQAYAEAVVVGADAPVEVPTVVFGVDVEVTEYSYDAIYLSFIGDGTYTLASNNGITYNKTYPTDAQTQKIISLGGGKTITITRDDGAVLTIPFSRGTKPASLVATKATSPAVADGTITGIDANLTYQVNSVSSDKNDANWMAATVENGAIVGLVPGTYYVRVAAYYDAETGTYYMPSQASDAVVVGSNFELAATPVYGTDVTIDYVGYNWMILTFKTPGTYSYDNSANSDDATVVVDETTGPVSAEMRTNVSNTVTITRAGDGVTTADSLPLTLAVPGREVQPTDAMTATGATTAANNDGTITGIDAAKNYEINSVTNDNSSKDWTAATVVDGAIVNLVPGTYYVRVAGYINEDGTYVLASKPYAEALTVAEFVATQVAAPTEADVTLVATGDSTATLTFLTEGTFTYQVGSAEAVAGSGTVELTGLADGSTVTIIRKGDGETTLDSDALVFTLTKAAAPAGLTVVDCENAEDATGEITGLNAGVAYQYMAVEAEETNVDVEATALENPVEGAYVVYAVDGWIDVTAGATEITGLEPGTYAVRVAPNGTTLASEAVTYTVAAYEAPAVEIPYTFSNSMQASLTLESIINLNVGFKFNEALGDTAPEELFDNLGLLIWDADALPAEEEAVFENCDWIVTDIDYNTKEKRFEAHTAIMAAELGDQIAFRPYYTDGNGNYVYGRIIASYSPKTYCYNMLNPAKDPATDNDALMVAILNYGAAAQIKFNHNTDALMNSDLTDDQKALVWDGSLLTTDFTVSGDKEGELTRDNPPVNSRGGNLTLEGAIDVNFYFKADSINVAKAEILLWDADTYAKYDVLTEDSARTEEMVYDKADKRYEYTCKDVPAAEMFSPVYACAKFTDDAGNVYYSGVVAYSAERFALLNQNNADAALATLAKRIVIYGDAARAYFNK